MTIAIRVAVISGLCATLMILGACKNSLVDQRWGSALEANIAQMTANPAAGQQETGPIALDPHTGEKVGEGYFKGQDSETEANPSSIVQLEY